MCRNHSHLIASLIAEDTSGAIPVLTYQLAKNPLTVESPGGPVLILPTSGLLYVPSLSLAGSLQFPLPPMVARSMSLYYMPDGARTGILRAAQRWAISSMLSSPRSNSTEDFPTERVEMRDGDPVMLGGLSDELLW
jgi:hypothetical protein